MAVFKGERHPRNWSATHAPAANVQATCTRPAETGKRHICTGVVARIVGLTGLVGGGAYAVCHLRDGASGAGAILASFALVVPSLGAGDDVVATGLNIAGSVGNAMTLEFAAAGGGSTAESVTLSGYTV